MDVPRNPQQSWLSEALRGFMVDVGGDVETELANVLPADFKTLVDQSPAPPWVKGLLASVYEPEGFALGGVGIALAGLLVGAVGSRLVGPLLEPVGQYGQSLFTPALVPVGDMTTGRRWGLIAPDDFHAVTQKHGLTDGRADLMHDIARPRPGRSELLAALVKDKGAYGPTAPTEFDYPDMSLHWEEYTQATRALPSVSDLITMQARGMFTANQLPEWLARVNFDGRLVQHMQQALLTTLGPRDLSSLYYRQAIGRPWLDSELHRIQFDPHYTDMLLELTTQLPAALDYARFLTRGNPRADLPADDFARLGWPEDRLPFIREMSWSIPGPQEVARYHHRLNHEHDQYDDVLVSVGLHPDYTHVVDKMTQATPSISEYYRFKYRMELTGMSDHEAIRRLGYDPDWWNVWETLSHPYPSVQDLILMAVREVFTPEVAERFGQFEEIPDAYIDAAKKTGLSEEWARNYWAAHWTLPSAQMGFDMLHRGVIERADLDALFVALDIMPFWRDRISDISYRVLTRVDVRRMYGLGVLDESGVLDAYHKLGYAPDDADKMTAFTLAFVRRQEIGYTRSQVLTAYRKRAIDRAEATDMLALLGIHADDADFALDMEDFGLDADLEDERIDVIEAAFKKNLITWPQTSEALDAMQVEPARKTLLLNRWEVSRLRKQQTFSKAEVLRYYISGAIKAKFAEAELGRLGYDDDRVRVLLDDAALRGKAERGPRRELSVAQATGMLKDGILDLKTLRLLLQDYGWRDPELSMLVCDLAAATKTDLPEGMERCTPQNVSEMLSAN